MWSKFLVFVRDICADDSTARGVAHHDVNIVVILQLVFESDDPRLSVSETVSMSTDRVNKSSERVSANSA